MSAACEISYKVLLMIFLLAIDHTHYSYAVGMKQKSMGVVITDGWDFEIGEVNGTDYWDKGIINNES
jgi:hypothetical protein